MSKKTKTENDENETESKMKNPTHKTTDTNLASAES